MARALLNNPKIIILDEATSGLDTFTESKVLDTINKIKKTIIIVSHRINTLKFCDKVYNIEKNTLKLIKNLNLIKTVNFLKNKIILITGGTGSFGNAAVEFLTKKCKLKKIIIFSRDENKQYEMQKKFKNKNLRFFLGDIRDEERLLTAFKDVDYVYMLQLKNMFQQPSIILLNVLKLI